MVIKWTIVSELKHLTTPLVMAIGKETSNPLFSMIHLSQELTHLDVMRIVWNLFVLMYIWSFVAAKNGVFNLMKIIEIILMKILCWWCLLLILLFLEDLSRILNLTMSNSRLGEDCWEFCNWEFCCYILLLNTAATFKTLLLVILFCCSKDCFYWRSVSAED